MLSSPHPHSHSLVESAVTGANVHPVSKQQVKAALTIFTAPSAPVRVATAPEQKCVESTNQMFPLILSPNNAESFSKDAFVAWLKQNKPALATLLVSYGAIAFRGFYLQTANDFNDFLQTLGLEELPYVGGAAPRNVIVGNIVTTNEAPPEAKIPFHHEMAQVPVYPSTIFFYCQQPATSGGQTPILPSYAIYDAMKAKHPEFIEKLETVGVVYTRVLPENDDPTSPIGRGWKGTFQTEDRAVAEEKSKDLGVSLEWLPNGDVKSVSGVLSGVKLYPATGKKQFFNSVVAAYNGWKDSRNDNTEAIKFADGEKMDPVIINDAAALMDELCCDWSWEKGDVVMIDNHQVMHARRSFVCENGTRRRIFAALYK